MIGEELKSGSGKSGGSCVRVMVAKACCRRMEARRPNPRDPKEGRSPKAEKQPTHIIRISAFELLSGFGIRFSDFVREDFATGFSQD
jgi:hypothetical protein